MIEGCYMDPCAAKCYGYVQCLGILGENLCGIDVDASLCFLMLTLLDSCYACRWGAMLVWLRCDACGVDAVAVDPAMFSIVLCLLRWIAMLVALVLWLLTPTRLA